MTSGKPYSAFPTNPFREALLSGTPQVGCWCGTASPVVAEILGLAGFDWLLLDAEHSLNDVLSLVPQLTALKSSTSAPVVRTPMLHRVEFKRLLDAGFFNFLVPMVDSAEDAREAAAALRYPPAGVRGLSLATRSNGYGTVTDYFARVNDNVCLLAQIETQGALDNLDEIAAVDGVDCLFVGPSDLSAALGCFGDLHSDVMQSSIRKVIEAAARHGKASGILAPVESDARRYAEMGMNVIAVGSDIGLIRASSQALRDRFADIADPGA